MQKSCWNDFQRNRGRIDNSFEPEYEKPATEQHYPEAGILSNQFAKFSSETYQTSKLKQKVKTFLTD
jgi:hypothetical protein